MSGIIPPRVGVLDMYAGGIVDANVKKFTRISAGKGIHRHSTDTELYEESVNVGTITRWLHVAVSAGTVMGCEIAVAVKATNPNGIYVDLEKSTGGGAFATVLTGAFTLDKNATVRVAQTLSLDSTKVSLVDGDILRIVTTVFDSGGTFPKGLIASLTLNETGT